MTRAAPTAVVEPVPPVRPLGVRLGQSVAVDFHQCRPQVLANRDQLEALMLEAAKESGATVVGSHFHAFAPQGLSGVVVITESHFAVHTWPEYAVASVDLFTCGPSVDFERAVAVLRAGFGAAVTAPAQFLERGTLNPAALTPFEHVVSWREKFERERARNLSVAIDVFEAADHDAPALMAMLAALCEALAVPAAAPVVVPSEASVQFSVVTPGATIGGRSDSTTRRVYVSVMSGAFVEPRSLAEVALRCLRGARYGLRVDVQR